MPESVVVGGGGGGGLVAVKIALLEVFCWVLKWVFDGCWGD